MRILYIFLILIAFQANASAGFIIALGADRSQGRAVSADGSTVVGSNVGNAFRWDITSAMQNLGDLASAFGSLAYGVSADGSIVVGSASSHSFRWTAKDGMQDIGDLPGGSSVNTKATAVSNDGDVIVGEAYGYNGLEGYRWTNSGGMQGIGMLTDSWYSHAQDVSADGSVIAGNSHVPAGRGAIRWTEETGMQFIGALPGGNGESEAIAISGDGNTIVGWSSYNNISATAIRWTEESGVQALGFLPGGDSNSAYGVSHDGSVVVGRGNSQRGSHRAFIWTEERGMQYLKDAFVAAGVLEANEWSYLQTAWDVSADGQTIVGTGYIDGKQRAFIGHLGEATKPFAPTSTPTLIPGVVMLLLSP